eukprot:CAMPEP_0113963428 /NCGR_PEP_ID=MMETSP0011_2-20120614/6506_1 /TAXON_ID=101924 /ORGANISM="Rhodosorus marinus" /LENGTH=537 /DNA_ID=CAMNT_0000975473 /DNA_START=80 /DNA_END=1693 /DNA_ORIENTATION=- /assembly_acc=CAM_ASM_000156
MAGGRFLSMFAYALLCVLWCLGRSVVDAQATKPNILFMYVDDVSPRELRMYDAPAWVGKKTVESDEERFRAKTPTLDMMAREGMYFTKAWAAPVCSPSRAMFMTGRFAHLTKWWYNQDYGTFTNADGETEKYVPLYLTSPILVGHLAQQAGYKTLWAGKPGMKTADLREFGFDEGVFLPNAAFKPPSPYSPEFVVKNEVRDGKRVKVNNDTGEIVENGLSERSYFWKPHIDLMNFPGTTEDFTYWPHTAELQAEYGLSTYGPDVESESIINFMTRSHEQKKPFFIFHNSKLGHKAFNFIQPEKGLNYPPTPKLYWNERRQMYNRLDVTITGSNGVYETEGINNGGLNRHIEYCDYMLWQYVEHLKDLRIINNTIIIFASDNGTPEWGKGSRERQRGPHIPMVIYAPGMNLAKQGRQDVLVHVVDMLPTFADIMGVEHLLDGYATQGKNLWPYLITAKPNHRVYLYSYIRGLQQIRGRLVMRDMNNDWWKVDEEVDDYDSYPLITDWDALPAKFRGERDNLIRIMGKFDLYETEHDYI